MCWTIHQGAFALLKNPLARLVFVTVAFLVVPSFILPRSSQSLLFIIIVWLGIEPCSL